MRKAPKVKQASPSQLHLCCSVLLKRQPMKVRQPSSNAQVTWSKLNSSLPVGRHVVQSSGALIVKEVRPGDEGVYSCTAKNLLGSVNASAKLIVHCKLFFFQFLLSSFMPVLPRSSSRSHILLMDSEIFHSVFVFLFLFCCVFFSLLCLFFNFT